jgi:hypothetical protein
MSNLILGGIIGFLVGLLICYWKQIQSAYQNRGLISDVSAVSGGVSAAQDIFKKL